MSVDVLRPVDTGPQARALQWLLAHAAPILGVARAVWPIPHLGRFYFVTRYDDVREVFLNDAAFRVPYADNLRLIMGDADFFLGLPDGDAYRRDVAAMRAVVRPDDLAAIARETVRAAEQCLDAAGGRIDVVAYTRAVTFGVLGRYFGITPPANGDLRVWATRLFEFQFTYQGPASGDSADPLYREAARLAPLLRAHVDALIAAARDTQNPGDDVLARCMARQRAGEPGSDDRAVRSALIGFLVGGLPQPPMVLPHAVEQLLRRDGPRAEATAAARADDQAAVARYGLEALRFDPLAPLLQRHAVRSTLVAVGTRRQTRIPQGAVVGVCFASAMRDPRRVAHPERFDAERPDCDTIHFGYGLHRCFGEQINRVMLPAMLARLLARGIRRARGPSGQLVKRGIFADTLWVTF